MEQKAIQEICQMMTGKKTRSDDLKVLVSIRNSVGHGNSIVKKAPRGPVMRIKRELKEMGLLCCN